MKLRRLFLAGFKTFADKTELELSDGITAVVGPNGCGKSNIADAILWALGEQNPRLLRGSEIKDFIFAGAERRKPTGLAEVRLVLDNSDGSLPLEYSEIAITRRIYRSGESRFYINGTPCRLKDIVDLFLDTGMGRGAYSFVGQNEVDAVLSARPEDRRELVEEAAGVQKYRARKREALRKLETAELNLTRIRDILAELETQREPLREQAAVAERYLEITSRLREVEQDALVAEIHRCDYELYSARAEREEAIAEVAQLEEQLARLEREAASVRESLAEAEAERDAGLAARQNAASACERIERELQLVQERLRNAEQSAQENEVEIRTLGERDGRLRSALERDRAAITRVAEQRKEREDALKSAQELLAEKEEAARRAEEAGRDQAQAQRRLMAERAARESALTACRTRLDEARARCGELDRARGELAQALEAASLALAQAREAASGCMQEVQHSEAAHAEALKRVQEAEDLKERLDREAAACRRRFMERTARLQALEETIAAGEGLFQGVRAVLQASREGALSGKFVTVADALSAPDRLRTALDVALGSSSQNLICGTAAEAREAVEWLKAGRRGRATFLPLEILEPPQGFPAAALSGLPGAVGVASDLVRCDRAHRKAIDLLLNRVAIFEDLDSAIEGSRRLRGWSRIVTLEGELLTPGGAITGGDGPGRGPQLVRRKGEVDDLRLEVERLAQDLQARESRAKDAANQATQAAEAVQEAASAAASARTRLAAAERDVQACSRELETLEQRRTEAEAQRKRLAETISALEEEARGWMEAIEQDRLKDTSLDDALETVRAEAERCAAEVSRLRAEVTEHRIELGRLQEQERALKRSIASQETALAEVLAGREDRLRRREELGRAIIEGREREEELRTQLAAAQDVLAEARCRFDAWETERKQRLEKSFRLSGAIKETSDRRSQMVRTIHETDLRIARLEVRLSQAAQRLASEYEMTLEEALAAPEPPPMDRDSVAEIARLRREARAMGNVNTGAVEEFRRLTERYDFLSEQKADLERASAELRATIAEIDRNTRTVFLETFHAVQEQFQRLFERLFGGGTARLALTRPDDILETGIDIIVQPPGKRPQSLSLLSGGERALTAISLLFSFLAVRTSPFVVLDEVDAPLDGSNVDRFVDLLRDFARTTQFLVITHNPATIEAASSWYGVTMQEPGVSRVISYDPPAQLRSRQAPSADTAPAAPTSTG